MTARVLNHPTQINFVERAILHAFEQMGAQLEFPRPPHWPFARRQDSSGCAPRSFSSAQRQASAAALYDHPERRRLHAMLGRINQGVASTLRDLASIAQILNAERDNCPYDAYRLSGVARRLLIGGCKIHSLLNGFDQNWSLA